MKKRSKKIRLSYVIDLRTLRGCTVGELKKLLAGLDPDAVLRVGVTLRKGKPQ